MSDKDVAVVHGTALERGGGVQVAEELARTCDAPLYFGFCADNVIDRLADDIDHRFLFDDSFMSHFKDWSFARNLFFLDQFQHVPELHEFDVVIQSDSGTEWYVPPASQALIRYVHSLPGLPYHRFSEEGHSIVNRWYGFVSRILRAPNMHFPDAYLANSETTQRQLHKYLGKDSEVAYPPVDTNKYSQSEQKDFYFTLSRLTEEKKVGEIVETFTRDFPDECLIVGGSGPKEDELREMAGPNVEVRGWLDENEKIALLGSCKALLLNSGNESFGVVPVEAFVSGTPVIGARSGYTAYQIEEGWNGLLYQPGTLTDAIGRFERKGVTASREEIQKFAERFSVESFRETVRKTVGFVSETTAISSVQAK